MEVNQGSFLFIMHFVGEQFIARPKNNSFFATLETQDGEHIEGDLESASHKHSFKQRNASILIAFRVKMTVSLDTFSVNEMCNCVN